jgi:hypothetical protein
MTSVYHGDDDSVAVKTPSPRHKWNHRPNRVSISSHIMAGIATLPTFQQPYPIQRKKIRRSNRCIPLYASITRQLISTFVAPYPHIWRDPHHVENYLVLPEFLKNKYFVKGKFPKNVWIPILLPAKNLPRFQSSQRLKR